MIVGSREDIRRNIIYALLEWQNAGGHPDDIVDQIIELIDLMIKQSNAYRRIK